MENKNLAYKHFGLIPFPQGEVSSKHLTLTANFSNSGRITDLKFQSTIPELCLFIEANYDSLLTLNCQSPQEVNQLDWTGNISLELEQYIARSLVRLLRNYTGDAGALRDQSLEIEENILCFCAGVSYSAFKRQYTESKGNLEATLQETLVKAFCDQCESRVEKYTTELKDAQTFYQGKPAKEWIGILNELIEEFYLYCPPEYSNLTFKLTKVKPDKVIIKCQRPGSTPTRGEIQKTLANFINSELEQEIKISVLL